MSLTIHVVAADGVLLAGVVADGTLTDLIAEHDDDRPRRGDIYLGRIDRRNRGTGSAYVDLGLDSPAFLPKAPDGAAAALVVQIVHGAREAKSIELTTDIALPGALMIYRPFGAGIAVSHKLDPSIATRWRPDPPGGWILRRAAARAGDQDIADEAERLAVRWRSVREAIPGDSAPRLLSRAPNVAARLILDTPDVREIRVQGRERQQRLRATLELLAPDLADKVLGDPLDLTEEVPALLASTHALSRGASITIEATRALTAIDVDAGGASDHFQVNREAARAIARQLRLRNIAGIVVVDFISMKRRDARTALVDVFRDALDDDPARVRLSRSMSALGLVELARERRGPGLAEVMSDP